MKALVLSHRHMLFPWAHQLRSDGLDTEVLVWNDRYERAWQGIFDKPVRGTEKRTSHEYLDVSKEAETWTLTDSPQWQGRLRGRASNLFGVLEPVESIPWNAPSAIGAWFDGESWHVPHLLLRDAGLWRGGLGARHTGGLTLIRPKTWPPEWQALLDAEVDRLKSASFKGLVQVGLGVTPDGTWSPNGIEAGWPWLQSHAFLWAAPDEPSPLASALQGEPKLRHRFTVAAPISLAPWPYPSDGHQGPKQVEIAGPTASQRERVLWHDVQVVEGRLQTAGLHGLVGVAVGTGESFALARGRMLQAVQGFLGLPEVQVRDDVGARVEMTLAGLEENGLVL